MSVRVWMNKMNAQLVLATEQWEPIQVEHDEKFYEELLPDFKQFTLGRKLAKGLMVQVGWLVQNNHGIWFGLNMSAAKQFEDLGEA